MPPRSRAAPSPWDWTDCISWPAGCGPAGWCRSRCVSPGRGLCRATPSPPGPRRGSPESASAPSRFSRRRGPLRPGSRWAACPRFLGTAYGRWLLLKLVLFGALLPVAARNLLVWRRRLAAGGPSSPEALTALRRHVLAEAGLTAAILAVVAVLGLTTPARHDEIAWPLSFRFDWEATKTLPGVQTRVAIGSQVATLGLVATVAGARDPATTLASGRPGRGHRARAWRHGGPPADGRRRPPDDVSPAGGAVRGGLDRPGSRALPDPLPELSRRRRLRGRAGGRGPAATTRRSHGPARGGPHGGRPLLVAHPRDRGIRHAGILPIN